eukprot:s3734_g4.t1
MRAIWANGPFCDVPYDGFLKALMQLAAKESLLQPGKDECCRTFLKRDGMDGYGGSDMDWWKGDDQASLRIRVVTVAMYGQKT